MRKPSKKIMSLQIVQNIKCVLQKETATADEAIAVVFNLLLL